MISSPLSHRGGTRVCSTESMQILGYGTTTITARAGIPLPKSTNSGRTIFDDMERAARTRSKGLDWAAIAPVGPPTVHVDQPAPRKHRRTQPQRTTINHPAAIPEAVVARMIVLYKEGLPLRRVAEETGVSRVTVGKYLHQRNIEVRPPGNNLRYLNRDPAPTKVCVQCSQEFGIRDSERTDGFNKRATCSRECAGRYARAVRAGHREAVGK